MALTELQTRFIDAYMVEPNATQAAIAAGSTAKRADQAGHEFLSNPEIAAEIERRRSERSKRVNIDADWVLKRLGDEATADIAELYDENGHLKPVHDWPLIWRQGLVQGIEVEELFEGRGEDREHIGRVRKIKLDNRIKRIELIGKHIGVQAFKESMNLSGEIAVTISQDDAEL